MAVKPRRSDRKRDASVIHHELRRVDPREATFYDERGGSALDRIGGILMTVVGETSDAVERIAMPYPSGVVRDPGNGDIGRAHRARTKPLEQGRHLDVSHVWPPHQPPILPLPSLLPVARIVNVGWR